MILKLKKYLLLMIGLWVALPLFSSKITNITFLYFKTNSKVNEDISFFNRKCPELLYDEVVNVKEKNYTYDLAWKRINYFNKISNKILNSKTPFENGKLLKSDFVIYGEIIQLARGYKIDVKVLNIKKDINEFSISNISEPNEDVYSFLQKTAKEIDTNVSIAVNNSLRAKRLFYKSFSLHWGVGYPLPVGDFFNVQVGGFALDSGINFTHYFFRNKNIKIGVRASSELGFNYFVNNPTKIEGYFYDIILSFPLALVLSVSRRFNFVFATSYKNIFSVYSFKGFDSIMRSFFTYCPTLGLGFNFEFPISKNNRFNLGIKNDIDFIFYIGNSNNSFKIQYESGIYLLYKLEA